MYRVGLFLFVVVLLGASAFAGAVVFAELRVEDEAQPQRILASVEPGDLHDSVRMVSAVSAGEPLPVFASLGGMVTDIQISPGDIVRAGDVLFELDNEAVVANPLPYSPTRFLEMGSVHREVEALEQYLADVGLFAGTVDTTFTSQTRSAVRAWQDAARLPATGVIDPARFVVLPLEPATVHQVGLALGSTIAAGSEIGSLIENRRQVELLAPPVVVAALAEGSTVMVRGGGRESTLEPAAVRIGEPGSDATSGAIGRFVHFELPSTWPEGVEVVVEIILVDVRGVLTVPASALLVAPDGNGMSRVMVPGPGETDQSREVAVGAAAQGRVEIRSGLAEGDKVLVGYGVG